MSIYGKTLKSFDSDDNNSEGFAKFAMGGMLDNKIKASQDALKAKSAAPKIDLGEVVKTALSGTNNQSSKK